MKILITGATGYIGNKLANKLALQGEELNLLVRDVNAANLPKGKNIRICKGDITDAESLVSAIKDCTQVYHTAARVGVWAKDPSVFYDVNVDGTVNVMNAALQAGVEKIVFTSTCGVIGPSLKDPMTENDARINDFAIDYDLSKKKAEDTILQYARRGMNAVIVSPSKVHGPGNTSHALTANAVIDRFLKKKIALIPTPGTYKVCFAFIDDIVAGHILAMQKGKAGEKYILGGINISYKEFFKTIRTIACGNGHIIQLSKNSVKAWSLLQLLNYKLSGRPCTFTMKSIDHLFSDYIFSSEKAITHLGYAITPLDEALTKTIQFLKNTNKH